MASSVWAAMIGSISFCWNQLLDIFPAPWKSPCSPPLSIGCTWLFGWKERRRLFSHWYWFSPQISHKACEPPAGSSSPRLLISHDLHGLWIFQKHVVDYAAKAEGCENKTKRCVKNPSQDNNSPPWDPFIFPGVSTMKWQQSFDAFKTQTGRITRQWAVYMMDEYSCDGLFFSLLNCPQAFWMTQK